MIRRFLLALVATLTGLGFGGALQTATAQDVAGATAYTATALHVRERGALDAGVLGTLPRGTAVSVGTCEDRWCEVSTDALSGYAARRHLSRTPVRLARASAGGGYGRGASGARVAVYGGRGYTNTAGERIPSPAFTEDGRAPAGASARCRDGSYSFSASRRGTCSHHGGVARWL